MKVLPKGQSPAGVLLPARAQASLTVLNDASELSPVQVAKHLTVHLPPDDAFVVSVRKEIAEARSNGKPVAVSAARHSMGGQSLPLNGTAITLDQGWLETDRSAGTYRAAAGIRWSTVIGRLDRAGFSPAVMQ
jgi:FAD/FMN-containing dehydrogenase